MVNRSSSSLKLTVAGPEGATAAAPLATPLAAARRAPPPKIPLAVEKGETADSAAAAALGDGAAGGGGGAARDGVSSAVSREASIAPTWRFSAAMICWLLCAPRWLSEPRRR